MEILYFASRGQHYSFQTSTRRPQRKTLQRMLGMKQEILAETIGEDWTQKKISLLEGKESIEPAILENVAKALKAPAEAIRYF